MEIVRKLPRKAHLTGQDEEGVASMANSEASQVFNTRLVAASATLLKTTGFETQKYLSYEKKL